MNCVARPVRGRIDRSSPYHRGAARHAVDLVVPVGTPVRAVAAGTSARLRTYANGEKYLELKHGDVWSGYGHLSKFLVKPGQSVRKGQVVALSGDTGDLAHLPPHVHFELVRLRGRHWSSIPVCWERT